MAVKQKRPNPNFVGEVTSLSELTAWDHLQELRDRFFVCFCGFFAASLLGYFLREQILFVLQSPLDQPLYYATPAGGLTFTLSLCFFFGFLLSLPLTFFHLFRFVEPALPHQVKFSLRFFLVSSSLLVILGILFAYFVSLPAALHFFKAFNSDQIQALISTDAYFEFITRYLIGFALLFQLPVVMVFIHWLHPLNFGQLMDGQRWVILFSFIFASILTPTFDWLNQTLMAVPIILLYQLSILIILFLNKKKEKSLRVSH